MKQIHRLLSSLTILALVVAFVLQAAPPALAAPPPSAAPISKCTTISPTDMAAVAAAGSGMALWQPVAGTPAPVRAGAQPAVNPAFFSSYTLYRDGMAALLATAPREFSEAARKNPLVLSLPNPCGGFERFAVQESPIMEPGLAAKHPDIKTYRGRGVDDPAATIRFDLTPLGFHASVRSPHGAWYIDPYYHLDDSLYVTYFGRDLSGRPARRLRRARTGRRRSLLRRPRRGRRDLQPAHRRCAADVPARPDHRPGLRHLLRRPRQCDPGKGRADEPGRADLRRRHVDPDGAGR